MLVTVEGKFKDGKIELSEAPRGVDESRVIVTFLPEVKSPPAKMITFGMLRSADGHESTEEDFKIAEWHGEPEFDDVD